MSARLFSERQGKFAQVGIKADEVDSRDVWRRKLNGHFAAEAERAETVWSGVENQILVDLRQEMVVVDLDQKALQNLP